MLLIILTHPGHVGHVSNLVVQNGQQLVPTRADLHELAMASTAVDQMTMFVGGAKQVFFGCKKTRALVL